MKAYVIHIPTSEPSVESAHRVIETAKETFKGEEVPF